MGDKARDDWRSVTIERRSPGSGDCTESRDSCTHQFIVFLVNAGHTLGPGESDGFDCFPPSLLCCPH